MSNDSDKPSDEELNKKIEANLRSTAEFLVAVPDITQKLFETVATKLSEEDQKKLGESFFKALEENSSKVSEMASVLTNYTQALSIYASYQAGRRQEDLLKRQEKLNADILKSTKTMANATIVLAVAAFVTIGVDVILHFLSTPSEASDEPPR